MVQYLCMNYFASKADHQIPSSIYRMMSLLPTQIVRKCLLYHCGNCRKNDASVTTISHLVFHQPFITKVGLRIYCHQPPQLMIDTLWVNSLITCPNWCALLSKVMLLIIDCWHKQFPVNHQHHDRHHVSGVNIQLQTLQTLVLLVPNSHNIYKNLLRDLRSTVSNFAHFFYDPDTTVMFQCLIHSCHYFFDCLSCL